MTPPFTIGRIHRGLAVAAAVLGMAAGVAGGSAVDVDGLAAEIASDRDHISAPELAARIMRQDASLRILDLRPRADYDQLHIPTAQHTTLETLGRATFPREASIVLYSEGATRSAQAWVLLRVRGQRDVRFLREGIYEWLARVIEPRLAIDASASERQAFVLSEAQSRFFGGQPRAGVPRPEVPAGYWTIEGATPARGGSVAEAIRASVGNIRRRGC